MIDELYSRDFDRFQRHAPCRFRRLAPCRFHHLVGYLFQSHVLFG